MSIQLFKHNQIAYEAAVSMLSKTGKAAGGYQPNNLLFFTCAKLMGMAAEEITSIRPDFIIFDEFYRCSAEMLGAGVRALFSSNPNVPVLGLSATAI